MSSARAYVTSQGLYEMALNGKRVGDRLFTPGWTSYNKRLQYQTYDVTSLSRPGRERHRRHTGRWLVSRQYGLAGEAQRLWRQLALLAQIVIHYDDGRVQVSRHRPWLESRHRPHPKIRHLQRRGLRRAAGRARLERGRLRRRRLGGRKAARPSHGFSRLVAPGWAAGAPHRRDPAGRHFAQPAGARAGGLWARTWSAGCGCGCSGQAGTTVTLRHAEVLDAGGNLYTANLRGAQQTTATRSRAAASEVLSRTSLHGFRYVPWRATRAACRWTTYRHRHPFRPGAHRRF